VVHAAAGHDGCRGRGQGAGDDPRLSGYFEGDCFVETSDKLQVEAVQDGATVSYNDDPLRVLPVLRVRGRYRDFAMLETPTTGHPHARLACGHQCLSHIHCGAGQAGALFSRALDAHEVQAADAMPTTLRFSASTLTLAASLARFVFDRRAG